MHGSRSFGDGIVILGVAQFHGYPYTKLKDGQLPKERHIIDPTCHWYRCLEDYFVTVHSSQSFGIPCDNRKCTTASTVMT
jgi:hypothetical protein